MKEIETLLHSPNEEFRKKAIALLVKQPNKENLFALQKIVDSDESVEVRFFARKALHYLKTIFRPQVTGQKDIQDSVKKIKKFSDATENEKMAFLQHVINKNLKETLPQLIELLGNEKSPYVLSGVVIAIGKFGKPDELKLLIPFLKHPDCRVRANTIEALEYLGNMKAYPYILEKLDDPDNRVRANAITSMKKLGVGNVLRLVAAMVTSQNISFHASAAYVLQFVPAESNVVFLANLLKSTEPSVRKNARKTLEVYCQKGIKKAEILLRDLPQENSPKREEAGWEREKEIVFLTQNAETLRSGLKKTDPNERVNSIASATQMIGLGIGPILLDHLSQEKDVKVVSKVLISLGQIQYREALPILIENLKNEDGRCRANAVEGIRYLDDPEGRKRLVPLLKDSVNRVRANAILALKGEWDLDLYFSLSEMANALDGPTQRTAIYLIMELEEPRYYSLLLTMKKSGYSDVAATVKECIHRLEDQGFRVCLSDPSLPPEPEEEGNNPKAEEYNSERALKETKGVISKYRLENVCGSDESENQTVKNFVFEMETHAKPGACLSELIVLLYSRNFLQASLELLRVFQKTFKRDLLHSGIATDLELWLSLKEHQKARTDSPEM